MTEKRAGRSAVLIVYPDQPLIGIPGREGDREVIRYFATEEEYEEQATSAGIQKALSLAGAWSDLDWDEMERALDRIRHESVPTPPIEL